MERNRKNILKIAFCMILLVLQSKTACAKDFGKLGHVYEIAEQDIIAYIKEKLGNIDLKGLEQRAKEKVQERVERPSPVRGITRAKESREFYYDPTFILDEPIYDHQGVLIYSAGTSINPLERVPLKNKLIFINGDDKEQVDFAIEEYKRAKEQAKIILIDGPPIKLQKEHKIWIYFDQSGILTKKLNIQKVPAVVSQDKLRLRINEIAL